MTISETKESKYETCVFHLLFTRKDGICNNMSSRYDIDIVDIYFGNNKFIIDDVSNTFGFDKVKVNIEINGNDIYTGRYLVKDIQRLLSSAATLIYESDYSVEEFYGASKLLGHSLLWFIDKHKILPPDNTEVILTKEYPNTTKNLMNRHSAKVTVGKRLITDDKIFGYLPDRAFKYINFTDLATMEMKKYGWESIPGAFYRLNSEKESTIYRLDVVRMFDNGTELITDTLVNNNYEELMKEAKSEVFTVTDDTYTKLSIKKDKPYFVPVWYKKFGEISD